MQKFQVCRAGNLLGYLRFLRATGIPADSGLRRANLPEHLGQTEEFSDCWLPYRIFNTMDTQLTRLDISCHWPLWDRSAQPAEEGCSRHSVIRMVKYAMS